jgi:Rieske Fe-S protein
VGEFTAPVWRFYFQREVVVARDARGLFAMTAVCTHQRCLVRPREVPGLCMPPVEDATNSTGELCCHCHGSVYDGQGVPLTGPATRPLTHFRVSVVDGRVRVHPAEPVPADARTVV